MENLKINQRCSNCPRDSNCALHQLEGRLKHKKLIKSPDDKLSIPDYEILKNEVTGLNRTLSRDNAWQFLNARSSGPLIVEEDKLGEDDNWRTSRVLIRCKFRVPLGSIVFGYARNGTLVENKR